MTIGASLYILYQVNTYIVILLILIGCVILLSLLYLYQSRILYQSNAFPQYKTPDLNPIGYRLPSERNLPYETVWLTTPDNIVLHSWFIRSDNLNTRQSGNTILFLHANAGNLGFRMDNLVLMYNTLQCNILILSYRGYGFSDGTPDENGLCIDAMTAYQWLQQNTTIDRRRIFVFGRSLGGAVAIALCNQLCSTTITDRHTIDNNESMRNIHSGTGLCGMIIENTFTNISDMAQCMFPFLRFNKLIISYLLTLKWYSIDTIQSIPCPILFISSTNDEIVPEYQMRQLYDHAYQSIHKQYHSVINGQHNNAFQVGGIDYTNKFIQYMNHCINILEPGINTKQTHNDAKHINRTAISTGETDWLDVTDDIVGSD